jgi:hypothetical protein
VDRVLERVGVSDRCGGSEEEEEEEEEATATVISRAVLRRIGMRFPFAMITS